MPFSASNDENIPQCEILVATTKILVATTKILVATTKILVVTTKFYGVLYGYTLGLPFEPNFQHEGNFEHVLHIG